ncbi:carbohydrate ABC transporter permease [candidate division WOR-3 bacterium]|nr:carbohydrate ABC transporter permease [candidate division WOR-3 bacterium]
MTERKTRIVLILLGSIFMATFCLTPFAYMFITSFSESSDFLSSQDFHFSLDNYRSVLTVRSLHFLDYLRNSLIVSGISAFLCVLIAGLAAYAITRLALPGKVFIMFFVLAVSMFPQVSMVGYLFKFMAGIGWTDTYRSLIFPYIAWILPLSLWILVSYFAQIPRDLDKAALIDGATHLQILRKIILPIALPGFLSCFLLAFIFAFNEFIFALVLTTTHHARTIPVGIALFQGLHGETPWGNIMAAATITTIPVVILTVIFQRHIIQGLTRGAVKS